MLNQDNRQVQSQGFDVIVTVLSCDIDINKPDGNVLNAFPDKSSVRSLVKPWKHPVVSADILDAFKSIFSTDLRPWNRPRGSTLSRKSLLMVMVCNLERPAKLESVRGPTIPELMVSVSRPLRLAKILSDIPVRKSKCLLYSK